MSETQPKLADVLALERTRLAADRTLMGWIRTALSLISFGFTIFKFLEYTQEQGIKPLMRSHGGPREVGLTLIGIGIFALVIACLQHWQFIKKLRPDQPYKPWDLAFVVAILIGLLGSVMFVSMILRAGPLGD
jgi:putative membrane protein